jgi:hypothetical protein
MAMTFGGWVAALARSSRSEPGPRAAATSGRAAATHTCPQIAVLGRVGLADEGVGELIADQGLGQVVQVRDKHFRPWNTRRYWPVVGVDQLDDAHIGVEYQDVIVGTVPTSPSVDPMPSKTGTPKASRTAERISGSSVSLVELTCAGVIRRRPVRASAASRTTIEAYPLSSGGRNTLAG